MSAIFELSPSAGTTSPSASSMQEDRDERERLREHLDDEQAREARAAPREAEARERVRGGGAHEHRADGRDARDDERVAAPTSSSSVSPSAA